MFENMKAIHKLYIECYGNCDCGCEMYADCHQAPRHRSVTIVALNVGCTTGIMNPSEWVDEA